MMQNRGGERDLLYHDVKHEMDGVGNGGGKMSSR